MDAQVLLAEIAAFEADLALAEIKGGPGSGNWGHAGRKGKRGGSVPRNVAMSRTSGKDAGTRQSVTKLSKDYSDSGAQQLVKVMKQQGKINSPEDEEKLYKIANEYAKVYQGDSQLALLGRASTDLSNPDSVQSMIDNAKQTNEKLKDRMALAGDSGGWIPQQIEDNQKMIQAYENIQKITQPKAPPKPAGKGDQKMDFNPKNPTLEAQNRAAYANQAREAISAVFKQQKIPKDVVPLLNTGGAITDKNGNLYTEDDVRKLIKQGKKVAMIEPTYVAKRKDKLRKKSTKSLSPYAKAIPFASENDWEEIDIKGGPGSGNWGHAGRKGKRGGSAPRNKGGGSARGGGQSKPTTSRDKSKDTPPEKEKSAPKPPPKSDASTDPDTWGGRLTESERDAVMAYAGSGYIDINDGLRKGQLSKENKKTVEELDKAIAKSKLKTDQTLYEKAELFRAANIPAVNEAIKNGKLDGLEFTDEGYVSTTTSKDVAQNFDRGEGSRLFVINAPKGTKAAPVSDLGLGLAGEDEVLMARKTKFKVSKVEKRKEKVKYRDLRGKVKTRTKTVEYVVLDVVSQG